MKSYALSIALAASLAGNVVLLTRRSGPAEPRPAAPVPAARTPDRPAPVAAPVEEAIVREEVRAKAVAPAPVPKPSTPAPPAIRHDPLILGVIQAQEEFGAFWKDLDRVFKARSKLEESRYSQSVIAAVQDFLGLPDAARPAFEQALRNAALQLAETRKEFDLARQSLPPKDKNNPAVYALYQQQKDALDLRYQERTKGVVDGVKAQLDLKNPRHGELAGNLEKLLRNLAPRP